MDADEEEEEEEKGAEKEKDLEEGRIHLSEEKTASTAPTYSKVNRNNRYELFEKLLSFLDTDEELNPVLCGYFCKLFIPLISNKTREVFTYIFNNPRVFDLFVKHIYSKSISEVLIRLLNASDSAFEDGFEGNQDSIRQSFIFKVVQRLGPGFSYEDHLNA